jgi:hypothetical protein
VALADQFRTLTSGLSDGWQSAGFRLRVADEVEAARASALLGPTNPGRSGCVVNFVAARRGAGVGPDRVRELLRRLDTEKIDGELELVEVAEAPAAVAGARPSLADAWDDVVATLPPDWSDLYAEVELTSTDYIEPGALRLSPLNPTRPDERPLFRFRAARKFGYGASPEMVRRCFERLDEARIRGEVRIVHAISDSYPARTQGPVWYEAGKVI